MGRRVPSCSGERCVFMLQSSKLQVLSSASLHRRSKRTLRRSLLISASRKARAWAKAMPGLCQIFHRLG